VQDVARALEICKMSNYVMEEYRAFIRMPIPSSITTQAAVSQIKELYEAAANYWTAPGEMRVELLKIGWSEEQVEADMHMYDLAITIEALLRKNEYLQSLRKEVDQFEGRRAKASRAAESDVEHTSAALKSFSFHGKDENTSFSSGLEKIKVKTRAPGAPLPDGLQAALEQVVDAEPEITATPVSVRSLALFEKMLSRTGYAQGPTRWTELVAALADAGWNAVPRGGSAVSFHSDNGAQKRSIVLHRPHGPEQTMSLVKLRSHGKRFRDRFQWHESTLREGGGS
jgi:hypothetical protein